MNETDRKFEYQTVAEIKVVGRFSTYRLATYVSLTLADSPPSGFATKLSKLPAFESESRLNKQ